MSALAEGKIREVYMKKQRRNLVVLFEELDLDWCWDEDELNDLAQMNNEGCTIEEMNEVFEREDPDEILLALIYLAKIRKIKRIDMRRLKG